MREKNVLAYKNLIEQIDRFVPWFIIAMVIFYSALASTMVSIILYFTAFFEGVSGFSLILRWILVFVAMFIPIYTSLFPFLRITRMLKFRIKLNRFVFLSEFDFSNEESINKTEIKEIFENTQDYLAQIPQWIFFSFVTLIFAAMLILLILPLYLWV